MVKICICDLDGVVCDSTERFKRAEQARNEKKAELDKEPYVSGDREESKRKIPTDLYWSVALSPDLLQLDTLIDGALVVLKALRKSNYEIVLMTSRPDNLRNGTKDWLYDHGVIDQVALANTHLPYLSLIMKAPAFQYTKTTVWKAGMVQTLAHLYNTSEVLVIEDEAENAKAILNAWTTKDIALTLCNNLDTWKG